MTDYEIQTNTRRCAVTGRELRPGEKVYTVLREDAGQLVRQDFSAEGWQGPPPGAFSFWVGKVPIVEEARKPQLDEDLLFDCFLRLAGETAADRIQFRYVVALLLLRRKRLKFETAKPDNGREIISFRCPRTRELYEVVNPGLTEEEMATVQEEVFRVLGWH